MLAVVTGGVGAVASLGTQARKLSQMKKLGELFSELAELLKKVPKAKVLTMRKEKERAEQKERKKAARRKITKAEPEDASPDNASINVKSVDELIDSDLDLSNSLNGKTGEDFKNNALIDFHLHPDMDTLTKDEYMSLHVYTTNLYKPINDGLRGFSPSDKEKWSKVAEGADSALAKLSDKPSLRYEGQVIRGDEFSDDLLDELFPEGGIHQDMGFKSSSSNMSKPFPGNTVTIIKSKSGINIQDVSVKAAEEEVLFRPGVKFQVMSKKSVNGKTIINLEEI